MHSPDDMSLESDGGMILMGKQELREKPVPMPLCPPQSPHGLTQVRTRASAVRGRRLMTWAMAQPYGGLYLAIIMGCNEEPYQPIFIALFGVFYLAIIMWCNGGSHKPIVIALYGGLCIAIIMGCYGGPDQPMIIDLYGGPYWAITMGCFGSTNQTIIIAFY
jgi:hypothetical protein